MKAAEIRARTLLILSLLAIPTLALAKGKHPSPSPAPTTSTEMNKAFQEFAAAAERLGKTVAKAADENTAETREKLMHTMSGAMLELSQTMNQTSAKLEARAHSMATPSPSPAHSSAH